MPTAPRPDALELLTRLVKAGGPGTTGILVVICASHNPGQARAMLRGRLLTPGGPRQPRLPEDRDYVDCDSVIWAGALINLAVVERVGLPRAGTLGCWPGPFPRRITGIHLSDSSRRIQNPRAPR
jgi:hypothetical protein